MRALILFIIMMLLPIVGLAQFEQYIQDDPEPTAQALAGGTFSVLSSGSGIGGFYEHPLPGFFSVGLAGHFYIMRDNGQITINDPYTGYPVDLGKKNNVFLFDLGLLVKKRLFTYQIDDQFRPFIAAAIGPIYGMNFPESSQAKDQYSWAASAALGGGIDILLDSGYMMGFQFQYRLMRFNADLGEIQQGSNGSADLRLEVGKVL